MDTQPNPNLPNAKGILNQIEDFFYSLYKKVPFHFPANIREIIVKFGPIILLIALLLSIPAILTILGIGAVFAPYAGMFGMRAGGMIFYSAFWIIGVVFAILGLILALVR